MRRRKPEGADEVQPATPDFGPMPVCVAEVPWIRGYAHPENRVQPCRNCPTVSDYCQAVDDHLAALSAWQTRTGRWADRSGPLDVPFCQAGI